MRRLHLVLVTILGATAAAVPSLAAGDSPPTSGSFSAVDLAWNASGGGNQVTVAQGGTVSFGYPSGGTRHNADFGTGPQPTSCTQTAGASSGSAPPLPNQPTAPGWTGTCTFNAPGTYTFHCDLHPFMTGTIVVEAPGTTTSPGPAPPSPGTTTPSNGSTTPPTSPPATSRATLSAKLNHNQHGPAIVGSVVVPADYAGGSLEVDVFSSSRSLRVGHLVRSRAPAGTLRFSVRVHRPLHGHRRLALMVHMVLRASGHPPKSSLVGVLLSS